MPVIKKNAAHALKKIMGLFDIQSSNFSEDFEVRKRMPFMVTTMPMIPTILARVPGAFITLPISDNPNIRIKKKTNHLVLLSIFLEILIFKCSGLISHKIPKSIQIVPINLEIIKTF